MKKKNIVLLIAAIAYSYLFYKQSTGINLIIFSTLLISCLLWIDKTLFQSKLWIAAAAGALITAVGALLYGTTLSAIGNVFSLLLLAHLSLDKNSSFVFSLMQSVVSYLGIFPRALEKIFNPKEEEIIEEAKESRFTLGNILKFVIPIIILTFFFFIYKASNPIFEKFVNQFHFEISWGLICFFIGGLLLMYGFFYQKKLDPLTALDLKSGNSLSGMKEEEFTLFSNLDKEFSAAIMTFILLNILLLLVNILDLNFILSGKHNDVTDYSQYVHQGINSSIFSVLIAILVTLYFFRGNLNFFVKNKQVKLLALIWIFLNAILIASCFHKNYSYIHECGLTHKRIGVYIYLFLTFIGLVTTWIKIMQLKSNWFLVRMNVWPIYLVLVFSTLINWNKMILDYNSQYKSTVEREYYLYHLEEASLPFLVKNWKALPSARMGDIAFRNQLEIYLARFVKKYKKTEWQSWNLEDERIYMLLAENNQSIHPKMDEPRAK